MTSPCTDYWESSKIVIHRSRSRDETRAPIISVITGFLEGKRAPRVNEPRWNGAREPTRMESSQRDFLLLSRHQLLFSDTVYLEIVLTTTAERSRHSTDSQTRYAMVLFIWKVYRRFHARRLSVACCLIGRVAHSAETCRSFWEFSLGSQT